MRRKKVLIIGGGNVACQKLKSLLQFTKDVTVLSPRIAPEIIKSRVKLIKESYDKKYLKGFHIVYSCTDDEKLNRKISEEAGAVGALVNVVDNPKLSDFISPAVYKKREMVVAVSSGGKDVLKTVRWRDRIKSFLEKDRV